MQTRTAILGGGALLGAAALAYARWEAVFVTQGFGPLRAEWLAHAARLGEVIRARTGTETREGIFETIDDSGALILRRWLCRNGGQPQITSPRPPAPDLQQMGSPMQQRWPDRLWIVRHGQSAGNRCVGLVVYPDR